MGEARDEFEQMIPSLNANRKVRVVMEGWPRIVQFELTGETGPFHIVVDRGQISLGEGPHAQPDIVMVGDGGELAKVVRMEKDITHPVAHGQIKLTKGRNIELVAFARILGFNTRK